MTKMILTLLLSFLVLNPVFSEAGDSFIKKADDITYDWLVKYGDDTGLSDHVPHFRRIFDKYKARTFLEFGVGYATKYFLDSCNKVISVEFVTSVCRPDPMRKFLELYRGYSNWIPIVYFSSCPGDVTWAPYKYLGTEAVFKANSYQPTGRSYARIDGFYLKELDAFIDRLLQAHAIDIAFVSGGGLYIRGDLVELLFGKVPVIVAHHTSFRKPGVKEDLYGYSKVVTPEDYEEIYISAVQGTTVWIKKTDEFRELAEEMKKYAKRI